ncbi:MAG: hypothetical protein COV76_00255 [Candidatus Omnitrophica bacterium CG11_big_fil_rev_8_21_14_0_20_64_10]|nr:MAG: hypothetical protein COV76_00255 [Candidatus Omnitrophica bacterium CG11_big_fil_rev_8_21_14_0_20_64_10]
MENDTAWAKPITLGYVTTDYAEILEGVQEGNQVVTEARGELSDGAPVSLIEVEEAGIERAEPGSPSETRDGGER